MEGDSGGTRYSPLDQINASNVKNLQVAWRWKAQNMGPTPQAVWEVTPLMAGGKLYFTAGTGRTVIAADAATGETLWTIVVTIPPSAEPCAPIIAASATGPTGGETNESYTLLRAISWWR
jgi:glucose dehydrogenase